FTRAGIFVVVLALMQTPAQARRLLLVSGESANLAGIAGDLGLPPFASLTQNGARPAKLLLEHGFEVMAGGGTVGANRRRAPGAAGGSHWLAAEELALGNPDTSGSRERRLAELERAQPRRLLAPGLPHNGQTKMGQLRDAEAMAPTDAAAAPTAPLIQAEPGDADGLPDPALASEKGGSVLVRQGSLPNTLDKYLDALTIAERLAEADPDNADWQRDLAVSHEKIGDALLAQGNL